MKDSTVSTYSPVQGGVYSAREVAEMGLDLGAFLPVEQDGGVYYHWLGDTVSTPAAWTGADCSPDAEWVATSPGVWHLQDCDGLVWGYALNTVEDGPYHYRLGRANTGEARLSLMRLISADAAMELAQAV